MWCEAFHGSHLQDFLKAISKKDFGSGTPRLWGEARSIRLILQIPSIRAHALEGRLFRSAVAETLQDLEIHTEVLLERDAYPSVAARLKQSSDDVKRAIQDLGRSAPAKGGPWRSEQKLAALAALFVLR